MKIPYLISLLSAFCLFKCQGQAAPSSSASTESTGVVQDTPWAAVKRDGDSRTWQKTTYETLPSGQKVPHIHQYTELATGLHYWSNGQWMDSKDEIDVLPNGTAAATHGQHKAYFPGDIYQGTIQLVTPDGKMLQSRPLGLSYDDGTNTVMIAELKSSEGELVGSNQVLYPDAFTDFRADILYTYTKAGFEQDIILRESPLTPESFGLNPATARLQVLTEFFDPPQPQAIARTLPEQAGLALTDESLNFGAAQMMPGRAFLLGADAHAGSAQVGKSWVLLDGRQFLVEEVPVDALADELAQLPSPTASIKPGANSVRNIVSARRLLPTQRLTKTGSSGRFRQMAQTGVPSQGLVLDYVTLNTSQTNYVFQSDTTYYISGSFNSYGTNTFEGGTILKYATNGTVISITPGTISSSINWKGSAYRPVIFTGKDDNSVGETMTNSTGNPSAGYYGNPMLNLASLTSVPTMSGLRMSYAALGIQFGGQSANLYNAQFVNCQSGFSVGGATVFVGNGLFAGTKTNFLFTGSATINGQNITFDSATCLAKGSSTPSGNSLTLTNCVFSNESNLTNGVVTLNGDHNGFYNCFKFGANPLTNTFYPFQSVGAGNYYLTNGCSFTNAGLAGIDPTLLSALRQRTTFAPLIYSNLTFLANSNLIPRVQRDTNGNPSLGYHYDPVDFLMDKVAITNSTLTVSNGSAIACYNEPGIQLKDHGAIISAGTPLAPNWLVRYQSVQEQPLLLGGTNVFSGQNVAAAPTIGPVPTGTFRLTKFACPAGGGIHFYDNGTTNYSSLLVQDCELYGGQNNFTGSTNTTATLKNNLFYRSTITAIATNLTSTLSLSNNMVYGTAVTLLQPTNKVWYAFNNDFDSCGVTNSTLTNGYNGYVNSSGRLSPTNAHDVVLSSFTYTNGPLGNFYQFSTYFVDAGSTNANLVGLYHYTTQTSELKETNSLVDIGYHYVALDTNGNPVDSNNDGIPDYLQDANGNGLVDGGETNWGLAILTQPATQTVPQGTNVTFTVTAAGINPLSYQWYFNGTNLVGATSASLNLTSVQVANQGNYYVVVTNVIGSLTSSVAALVLTCDASPSGLVAWWQAESNALDSVASNNGTLTNGVTFVPGKVGLAFNMDGTNGFVQVPNSTVLCPTNFTIEAWVRFSSLDSQRTGGAPAGEQFVINKNGLTDSAFFLGKARSSGDYLLFGITDPTHKVEVDSAHTIQTNVWYHMAGVRGSNYIQFYLNGQYLGQTNASFTTIYTNSALDFGSSGSFLAGWDAKFAGTLDEVSLYNRALSSNEIVAIYNAGSVGKCQLPPAIITQPSTQMAIVGSTVTFMVVATGSQPLNYQWYYNGTNLIAGATSATFILPNVQTTNSGYYSVTVSNRGGAVTSSSALLDVETCFSSVDVAMVIDRSGSMGNTNADGMQKLLAVRIAATNFLQNLNFTNDQAALFSFNNLVTTNQTLTNSLSILLQQIGTIINPTNNTFMSNALESAQTELASPRHHSYALPVMVFLSDGDPNDLTNDFVDTSNLVLSAATQVKSAGTRLITIAFGTDADTNFMRLMATSTNDFYYANTYSQLTNVYNLIAGSICRGTTNSAPTVQIISPVNQTLLARSNVVLSATATNATPGVTISWVEFFANVTNSLGFVVTPSNGLYQLNWIPPVSGTNILTALVLDSHGSNAWSAPVTNYVRNLPSVAITSPANGQIFPAFPTNITISATAVADRATITNVAFYQGTNFLGSTTNGSPYQVTANFTNGTFTLTAKATDSTGAGGISFPVIITVEPSNQPPSVYAGPNQTNNLSTNAIQLIGLASDDGLPFGSTLMVNWTNIGGPTNVILTITNQQTTYVYFSATGVYQFVLSASDGQYTNYSTNSITVLPSNLPPYVNAGPAQRLVLPALPGTNLVQTIKLNVITNVPGIAGGIDYFAPSNCAIFTVYEVDESAHFYLLLKDGTALPFFSISNAVVGNGSGAAEAYVATARNTNGGFNVGEMFFGNSLGRTDCEIVRVSPNGATQGALGVNQNAWVVLSEPTEVVVSGLWVDDTGVWGGDLLVLTSDGNVWRINSSGQSSLVASNLLNPNSSEGITTIPNDVRQYGPWAGRILVGGDDPPISAIDTNGNVVTYNLGIAAENIHVIPPNQNLLCVVDGVVNGDYNIYGTSAPYFQGVVGDLLVADEHNYYYRVHWNGNGFDVYRFNNDIQAWAEANFTPEPLLGLSTNFVLLQGVVTDDSKLYPIPSNLWTRVSGNGTVTFGDPTVTNTYALFSDPGTNYLRLSANDGQFVSYDETRVDVFRNQAPVANAGTNQVIVALTNTVTLSGTVSDDGLPYGVTNVSWTLVDWPSGGQGVVIASSNQPVTTVASFPVSGNYVFQFTADDGQATNFAEVTITVACPDLTLSPAYGWPIRTNTPTTFTARLVDQYNQPMAGSTISFRVIPGSGSLWTTNVSTDANGNAQLIYFSSNPEQDYIQASNVESGVVSPMVIQSWGAELDCETNTYQTSSGCWSLDWPTNEIHYADYYLINATAGLPVSLNYIAGNNLDDLPCAVVLELIDPFNNVVAVNANGFLNYTPLYSGYYLVEMVDYVEGEIPQYQLSLACGTNVNAITASQLQVLFNNTNLPSGGTVVFPVTTPGSPTNVSLVITNPGNVDLIIYNIQLTGDFTNVTGITAFDIPPGVSTNLLLGFNASSNETTVGEMLIQTNNDYIDTYIGTNQYVAYLVGDAFPTGAPPAIVLTSPPNGFSSFTPANISLAAQVTTGATNVIYVDFQQITTSGIIDWGKITNGAGGFYSLNAANVPAGDYVLTAVAVDAVGRSAAATPVTVHVLPTNGNHPPVAVTDNVTVRANSQNNILYPLRIDYDPDNDPLTIIQVQPSTLTPSHPVHGIPVIVPGGQAISYTPPSGQGYPIDGFSYEISDGRGGTAWGSVYVTAFAPPLPAVTIANPPNNYSTNAGAVVPLVAYVTPSQYVTNVDFYLGQVLLGRLTNGVNGYYTNYWTASYDACGCGFTAQASDSFGQVNTSQEIQINVTTNGLAGALIARLDNLVDANGITPFTNGVTIREGVFNLYGRAYHSLGSNVVWQLGVYSQDGTTLLRNLTPTNTGTIGSSSTSNVLTSCDLTTLINGVYDLKFTVSGGYQTASKDVQFHLESNLKLGQFSFSQQDLVIPVSGIPITVTRTYNSINPDKGDFGYGWTYALNSMDVALDESREDVLDLISGGSSYDLSSGTFNMRTGGGYDVTLTLPNGQRTTFYFNPVAINNYQYVPAWQAAPGVTATLGVQGNPVLNFDLSGKNPPTWTEGDNESQDVPYNNFDFEGYVLTNQDGTVYYINRDDMGQHSASGDWLAETYGPPYLAKIVQRAGDNIAINLNSIVHTYTNGATSQIVFQRNSDGLITSITDPSGLNSSGDPTGPPAVQYQYDENDNLISVLNLVNRSGSGTYVTNSFSYTNANFPHYITGIINADGAQVAENFYDNSGKLIAVQDANGNLTQFIHNLTNSMEVVIDRLGHTNTYVYDLRGNVTAQTNALNQVTTMAYDAFNNKTNSVVYLNGQPYATNSYVLNTNLEVVIGSTDPLGHTNGFTYDPTYGLLLTSSDAKGNMTVNNYDSNGNLISTTDALGHGTTNSYNGSLIAGSIDAVGTITANYYDGNNNLIATATVGAGTILSSNTFAYDSNLNRTGSTVWRRVGSSWVSATTTFVYDAMNRVVQTIDPDGGTNTVVYDPTGKQQATIDKLGRTTSYIYDALGRLVLTMYPDSTTETNGYDANGNRFASADRLNRITLYYYDALNRLTNTTFPDGASAGTAYDGVGRVAQTIDARGMVIGFNYDAADRQLAVTNAFGTSIAITNFYSYDANGNQTNVTDDLNHSTASFYDVLNRQTNVTFADGTKQINIYDPVGRRIASVDQANITNWFAYDGAGRLTSVTNALGIITRYQYDEAGNETAQVDALSRTNLYLYDGLGRRIQHTMPGGQSEGFAYDLVGNLIYYTNFNQVIITNVYDSLNRLTARIYPNGTSNTFTYTLTGQRATMNDASGAYAYAYDLRDRLLTNSSPAGKLIYGYDANGNVTNMVSSSTGGTSVTYQYDALNRLTNVVDARLTGTQNTAYGFDAVGNLQRMQYPNSVTNVYQYDSLNRLTNLVWKTNGTVIASFAYQLGLTGNRTNLSETVGAGAASRSYTWQYDTLYRLTNENVSAIGSIGYVYDPVGNRTNRQSSIFQLSTASSSYNTNDWLGGDVYDSNGNTRTNASLQPYQYDYENRLTNFNNSAVVMVYDADGNRVKKVAGGKTTLYLVDTRNPSGYAQVLEELTATGTTNFYTYGLDLISQRTPGSSPSTNFFTYDGHGSTRMLTDKGGKFVNAFAYDAYGTLIASNATPQTVYLYCGEQFDTNLNFYYLRARYLNPGTGRFWTMDTDQGNIEEPLSLHKYLYGADNPINMVDPSGHEDGLDSMIMPVFAAVFGATVNVVESIERKLTIYYNVSPANCPSDFDANGVQNLLQTQLPANVFDNVKGGFQLKVLVHKGVYTGDLGWTIGRTVYVNQVNFGWGNIQWHGIDMVAHNNQEGEIKINLKPIKNMVKTTQLWANLFAHEGVWGNVAGNLDDNSTIPGDIANGQQDGEDQYTVSLSSRLTILKKCGLTSN